MNEQTAPNFWQKLLKQCKIVPFFNKKLKEGQNRGKMHKLPKQNLKIGTFISLKTALLLFDQEKSATQQLLHSFDQNR